MEKFIGLWDIHYGYERKNGHKVALHDIKAVNVAMQFAKDFKPDYFILGGDILDCGSISHHNSKKPGNIEGLRLLTDAKELHNLVIKPAEACSKKQVFITGNHCDWLNDLVAEIPALEGIIDAKSLLKLEDWEVLPVGGAYKLGKMVFIHGDQIKGGANPAKWAVDAFERNVFFGHHHTHQAYTKVTALDQNGHTGTCVPCLCKKDPNYGEGSPNRWMQGFLYGWLDGKGFNTTVVIIINGRAIIQGKLYAG